MDNVNYKHINVKNISLKELSEIFYQGALARATGSETTTEYFVIDQYQIYIPKFSKNLGHKNCGFEVPEELLVAGSEKKHRKRADKKERFKVIYDHKQDNYISDTLLLVMEAIQLATAKYISIEREFGKYITYKGRVKGDDVYNYNLMKKCIEDAEKLQEKYKWTYFTTITYSYNLLSRNRELAFEHFVRAKGKFIKKLKRKFGVEVQSFVEVTDKGYPHAHLIIYSDKPLCGEKEPVTKPQKIKRGKLYRFIEKNIDCPIFDLRKAVPGKLSHYLVKYMAKSTEKNDENAEIGEGKLSKGKRKELMTRFFPCVFNYRSYSCTWKKQKETKKEKSFMTFSEYYDQKFTEKSPATEQLQGIDKILEAARRAAHLINFRIKENTNCAGRAFFLKRIPFTPLSKKNLGQVNAKFVPAALAGEAIAVPLGCRGCKFRELIRENYQNPDFLKELFVTRPFYTSSEAIEIILAHKNHLETIEKHKKEERVAIGWKNSSSATKRFIQNNMAESEYFEAILEGTEKEFIKELKNTIYQAKKEAIKLNIKLSK